MPDNKKKDDKKKEGGSKINNAEWGMAIGALLLVDLVEIGLDFLFGLGAFVNPFIDLVMNMAWPTYLYLRGVNLKSAKNLATLITGGGLQQIPGFDGFWAIEGLVIMLITKAEEKIKEETGVDVEKVATAEGDKRVLGKSGGLEVRAAEGGGIYTMDENELAAEKASGGTSEKSGKTAKKKKEEEDKKKKEEEEKKKKGGGGESHGGGGGGSGGGQSGERGEGSNPSDRRGGTADAERAREKRRLGALDNLLDLSGLGGKK